MSTFTEKKEASNQIAIGKDKLNFYKGSLDQVVEVEGEDRTLNNLSLSLVTRKQFDIKMNTLEALNNDEKNYIDKVFQEVSRMSYSALESWRGREFRP
jgi:uncharacterized protein with GYD domain